MIARGKILEKTRSFLVVDLYEVYRGDETRCKIKIFNQSDYNCTGTIFDYELLFFGEVGQTVLFHADKIESDQNNPEEVGEYRNMYANVGSLGRLISPMIQEGDQINGQFLAGINSIKVEELGEKLLECGVQDLLPFSRPLCGEHLLNFYPNPALDFFYINDEIGEEAKLSVYNTAGQLVLAKEQVSKGEKILLDNLSSGLYLVVVSSDNAIFKEKLLIS